MRLLRATHIGFDELAAGPMRLFGNPDRVGCWLGGADPDAQMENPFSGLFGTPEQGLLDLAAELPEVTYTPSRRGPS